MSRARAPFGADIFLARADLYILARPKFAFCMLPPSGAAGTAASSMLLSLREPNAALLILYK